MLAVRTAQVIILITKKKTSVRLAPPWQLFLNLKKKKIVRGDSLQNHNFYEKRNFYIIQRLGKRP